MFFSMDALAGPPGQLGSDLVLLAIDPVSGRVRVRSQLAFGLMAAELVGLAAPAHHRRLPGQDAGRRDNRAVAG